MHGDYEDVETIQLAECASILDEIDMLIHKNDVDNIRNAINDPNVRLFRHLVNAFLSENKFVTQSMLVEALGITNDKFEFLYDRNATIGNNYLKKYLKPKVSSPYGEPKTNQAKAKLHLPGSEGDSSDTNT